jgi:hypothetical protein
VARVGGGEGGPAIEGTRGAAPRVRVRVGVRVRVRVRVKKERGLQLTWLG